MFNGHAKVYTGKPIIKSSWGGSSENYEKSNRILQNIGIELSFLKIRE